MRACCCPLNCARTIVNHTRSTKYLDHPDAVGLVRLALVRLALALHLQQSHELMTRWEEWR